MAVLFVLVGLFELIAKRHAHYTVIGLMWLAVGIGWGILSQFTARESRRQYFITLALGSLLIGASSMIAAGTDTLFGLAWLFCGIMGGINALQTREARPTAPPPDEPVGSTPSSASEPGPGR